MAPGDSTPLSLRPFPVADKKPKNVSDFIARVNAQPGGFRSLSEAKLREDAARQAAGDGDADDDDMDISEAEDDEEDEAAAAREDPNLARMDILRNIDVAANTALLTLDSLSLLLSKQNPTQASLTLSKQLREVAGIGTLGADRLEDANTSETKEKDQEAVAMGWTLMEINKTRDAAEAASSFLQEEVDLENKYWEDLIGVQSTGWSICKMPQERHTLGVRFGFSEAAAEFKNNGLAPMRRGEDGSVQLDCGRLGGVSERLVVTYEREGKVVGRSSISPQSGSDAPLEARVLEARNTLFAQELWYELSRESRNLAAYNVRPQSSSLRYPIDDKSSMIVELVSLDSAPLPDASLPENTSAEVLALALHILLSYSHRQNELMRTRPVPPYVHRSRGQQAYALLRPVIGRIIYLRNIAASTRYVGALVRSIKASGLPASMVLQTSQPTIPDSAPPPFSSQQAAISASAQRFMRTMLQPPIFSLDITVAPGISFTVRGRTFLQPWMATYYDIHLPPSSPLERLCPPHKNGYTDLASLADYLRSAITRLLTSHFLSGLPGDKWFTSISGASIRHRDQDRWELRFALQESNTCVDVGGPGKDSAAPVLKVGEVSTNDEGKISSTTYTYRADSDETRSSPPPPLASVVERVTQAVSSMA